MSDVGLCFSSHKDHAILSASKSASKQAIMALEPDLWSLRDGITPGPQDPRNVQTPLVVSSPLMKKNWINGGCPLRGLIRTTYCLWSLSEVTKRGRHRHMGGGWAVCVCAHPGSVRHWWTALIMCALCWGSVLTGELQVWSHLAEEGCSYHGLCCPKQFIFWFVFFFLFLQIGCPAVHIISPTSTHTM